MADGDLDWDAEINKYQRSAPRRTITSDDRNEQPVARPMNLNLGAKPAPPERKPPATPESESKPAPPPRASKHKFTVPEADDDDDDDDDDVPNISIDDDDDDDDTIEWIEYKSKDGQIVFFNPDTRCIRMPDEPEDVLPALPQTFAPPPRAQNFDRERRNSQIRQGAWQEEAARAGASSNVVNRAAEEEDDDEDISLDGVVDSLSRMVKNLDRILDVGTMLSENMCGDMEQIRTNLVEVHNSLEVDGKMALDNRNDVEALLEMNRHKWNFDNDLVDWYRAGAKDREYESYDNWHFPESFSEMPIPSGVDRVTATVRLPSSGSGNAEENVMQQTRVVLSTSDKTAKAISQSYSKIKGQEGVGPIDDYVLKALGLADYFSGERMPFSYQYVRQKVRDSLDLNLSLVKRPEPVPEPESVAKLKADYMGKIKPDISILGEQQYQGVSNDGAEPGTWEHIPINDLSLPFRLKVCGVDDVDDKSIPRLGDYPVTQLNLVVVVFHGCVQLAKSESEMIPTKKDPRWMTWMLGNDADPLYKDLPREARVGFILRGKKDTGDSKTTEYVDLGWCVQQLVDHDGVLVTGPKELRMWEFPAKDRGKHAKKEKENSQFIFRQTTRENLAAKHPARLRVEFEEFMLPVVAPVAALYREPELEAVGEEVDIKSLNKQQNKRMDQLIKSDSLFVMTPEDMALVWEMRHSLLSYPQMLPKFLQTVDWGNDEHKFEAHRLLKIWAPQVTMVHVLELLEAKYPDYAVRSYAVEHLKALEDEELADYLLQFTQCLKFENYHDSPLSRFLIQRAVRSPFTVGHYFFWHLKAELHVPQFAERYGVILEEYLSNCGRYANELRKQYSAVLKMQRVAAMIVRLKREEGYGDDQAMDEYTRELHKLNREFFEPMTNFIIPLDPKWRATTLIVEKCRYMSSKMVPLWLVFKNADESAPPIYIMFKSGDDLRQDILTLQMLRMMDRMWLADGLNMKLKPYKCIATGVNDNGDGVGMIEIVLNSDTTSGIQLKYGGGAMGALRMDPLDLFLHANNKGDLYEKAVDNFICSCAGYCVATFVMGIGDRHNGNIMLTKDGHLFHIDFGHFLGNFKTKFGINRERAAFVFTPEMAFVMGGKRYKKHAHFKRFLTLCSKAYKTLRNNASVLEILFVLMQSAGMPELMVEKDIHYMRDKLHLTLTEKKADKNLLNEINKSLDSTYRRFDNMIHNWKHG